MQSLAEGDLSERAHRRAIELANDADLRRNPRAPKPPETESRPKTVKLLMNRESRLPLPGCSITREYKGRTLEVIVLPNGFEFEGENFKSLSAVAKHITGSHCNGYLFFRLAKRGGAQ